MTSPPKPAATIAALNDAFRVAGPNGDWVVTSGVKSRGEAFVGAVIRKVHTHACFPPDDDPHGERDFGVITLDGVRVWFKIDYYDRDRVFGSDDPSDPDRTRRVLTILLPDEW